MSNKVKTFPRIVPGSPSVESQTINLTKIGLSKKVTRHKQYRKAQIPQVRCEDEMIVSRPN